MHRLSRGIPPAVVQQARDEAAAAHDRIASKVVAGAPFFETYATEVLESAQDWRRRFDEQTAQLILDFAADDVAVRDRIKARMPERKSIWRLW
jgi:hypothetical protein